MPARALRTACATIALATLLVGCTSGGEPGPTVTETVTVTPTPSPTPSQTPESDVATDVEPSATFESADGSVTFSYPASWSAEDRSSDGQTLAVVLTPEEYLALEVSVSADQQPPYPSRCDEVSVTTDYSIIERRTAEPLIGALATTAGSGLEVVTYSDGTLYLVSLLQSSDVDAGCVDQQVPVGSGTVRATSPYGTDAPFVVYALFDSPEAFLDSTERRVIVSVLESVRVSALPIG